MKMRGKLKRLRPILSGAAVLLALAGCATPGDPEESADSTAETAGAPAVGEIRPLPELDPSGLEPQVLELLQNNRSELEAALSAAPDDAARAAAWGRAGMMYHAHGVRDAAEVAYGNAALLDGDDARWPNLLGHLYGERGTAGDAERAATAFRRSLELNPDAVAPRIYLARLYLAMELPADARPLLEQAVELDPASAAGWIELGKLELAEKNHQAAVEALERALALEPRATQANYPLGLAYRGIGDETKAQEYLAQRGTGAPPVPDPVLAEMRELAGGWRIHQNRGATYFEQGLYERALAEYREAAAAAPEESLVRTNLGATLTRLGRFDEARKEFATAVELDPGQTMAHFNLGVLAARRGDDEAAARHYEAAIRNNPEHLDSHFNLANALRRLGRFADSVPHYARVVAGDPTNVQARLGEAMALVRAGRWPQARKSLEASVEALPEDRDLRYCLARVLAAAPDDSVRDGRRAYDLALQLVEEQTSLDYAVTLGMAAAELGQFDNALYTQSQAIEAALRAGRTDLVRFLRSVQQEYQEGRACRTPWALDDPLLSPGASG